MVAAQTCGKVSGLGLEDIGKPRVWRMVEFAAGERCKVISGKGTYCIRNGAVTTFH